jgi:GMP synthase (glutamine-hydrolysing)
MAILVFEHSTTSGILRLGRTLRDYGHRLRIVALHRGEPIPPDLDDVDGIITCGGPQSANDDSLPWLHAQMDLLRAAHENEMPVVGICLGSQILARALAGEVARMEKPEIGWHEVLLSPVGREDPVFAGVAWRSVQPHWHHEHVVTLPPGARLLASSQHCRVQAWGAGLRTYGFQWHIEIEPDTMQRFAADDPQGLATAGMSEADLMRDAERHWPAFERLSSRIFEMLALLVMPVDRRYRGLVKDLHH